VLAVDAPEIETRPNVIRQFDIEEADGKQDVLTSDTQVTGERQQP
jgi:hypothetical protein